MNRLESPTEITKQIVAIVTGMYNHSTGAGIGPVEEPILHALPSVGALSFLL